MTQDKITLELTKNQHDILRFLILDRIEAAKKRNETQLVKIWQKHFSDIFRNGDMTNWSEL